MPSFEDQRETLDFDSSIEESELNPENEPEGQNEVSQYPGNSSQTTVQPISPVSPTGPKQDTFGKKHHFARPASVKRRGLNFEKHAKESPSSQLMAYILAEKEAEKTE